MFIIHFLKKINYLRYTLCYKKEYIKRIPLGIVFNIKLHLFKTKNIEN